MQKYLCKQVLYSENFIVWSLIFSLRDKIEPYYFINDHERNVTGNSRRYSCKVIDFFMLYLKAINGMLCDCIKAVQQNEKLSDRVSLQYNNAYCSSKSYNLKSLTFFLCDYFQNLVYMDICLMLDHYRCYWSRFSFNLVLLERK